MPRCYSIASITHPLVLDRYFLGFARESSFQRVLASPYTVGCENRKAFP